MRYLKAVLIILLISSCSALTNGVLGRIPNYDNNEYQQAVEIQVLMTEAEEFCDRSRKDFRAKIDETNHHLKVLNLYSNGLAYNKPITSQIELIQKNITELNSRLNQGTISQTYCLEKVKNLELMSDILRKSIVEKKHEE
jgi:hypothetical protein